MSINTDSSSSLDLNIETAVALKMANLAKNQQSREGQMALELIQSANPESLPMPAGNIGTHINIKV